MLQSTIDGRCVGPSVYTQRLPGRCWRVGRERSKTPKWELRSVFLPCSPDRCRLVPARAGCCAAGIRALAPFVWGAAGAGVEEGPRGAGARGGGSRALRSSQRWFGGAGGGIPFDRRQGSAFPCRGFKPRLLKPSGSFFVGTDSAGGSHRALGIGAERGRGRPALREGSS